MRNETLINLLRKVERKFDRCWIQIISNSSLYDLSGQFFDLEVIIEFDSRSTFDNIKKIIHSFRKSHSRIAVYDEGMTGSSIRKDIDKIISLENENHKVMFFSYRYDVKNLSIPKDHLDDMEPAETVLPVEAHYDFYNDFGKAKKYSKLMFIIKGKFNLYPLWMKLIVLITRPLFEVVRRIWKLQMSLNRAWRLLLSPNKLIQTEVVANCDGNVVEKGSPISCRSDLDLTG